jgi:hypothetical protein
MTTRNTALKRYAKKVRQAGHTVVGGSNGGGWVKLALAIGVVCENKRDARRALHERFPLEGVVHPKTPRKPLQEKPCAPAVTGDDFLRTYEWRRLRMQALTKYGARCQCCGATPATGAIMNVDHIKPRRLFPELALDLENLQVLCDACNHGKGNWDMTDWRQPTTTGA